MKFSLERLSAALAELVQAVPARLAGYCVGLSGGLDSAVLLHAMVSLRRSGIASPLRVLHVDHALLTDSGAWASRCEHLADAYGIECAVLRIDARPQPGESPEAAAREARYAALARALRPDEALLTAHHADDQLETVLLQLFRGGGLRGLAAMPRSARLGGGWHLRPLLDFERAELLAWAKQEHLEWIEDPSNVNARFDRNYLRHEVLPAVRARWPSVARTVARTAGHAAEAARIEDDLARVDLAVVRAGRTLALDRLDALDEPRQRAVVRAWLRDLRVPTPTVSSLAALLHDSRVAAADRVPVTRWPGAAVYRYRRHLYAVMQGEVGDRCGSCRPGQSFDLGAGQMLEWRPVVGAGLSRSRLAATVEVVRRASGERVRPAGSEHRQSFRKWLQQRAIVPWQRQAIPLVVVEGRIAAIADLAYMQEFAAQPGEDAWELVWRGRPSITESDFQNDVVPGGGRST